MPEWVLLSPLLFWSDCAPVHGELVMCEAGQHGSVIGAHALCEAGQHGSVIGAHALCGPSASAAVVPKY